MKKQNQTETKQKPFCTGQDSSDCEREARVCTEKPPCVWEEQENALKTRAAPELRCVL